MLDTQCNLWCHALLPHCLISDRDESTGELVIHHLHGKLNERIPQRIDTGQIDALVAGSSVRC
ncbi:hypothetical protein O4H46_00065 [Vibrio alginolyticus]|nr:hypothetical protein [Vibrio alginolyticus]MCZ4386689.1 hypothetical protein [Vibrio alginolyticus]